MTWRHAAIAAIAIAATSPTSSPGQTNDYRWLGQPPYARVTLTPSLVKVGERVSYVGKAYPWVYDPHSITVLPPDSNEAFTWSQPVVSVARGRFIAHEGLTRNKAPKSDEQTPDTLVVETWLQVFRTGIVPIPGLRFQQTGIPHAQVFTFPQTRLIVTSILTAADSNANLRPVHGPIEAPWWERVPWLKIALGLLALGAIVALVVWWRRRRKVVAPVAVPRVDPALRGLEELAALRALRLPESGRYAEHAFRLSGIARRYLEATANQTRPGDTTPELLFHLQNAGLDPDDYGRLASLLRVWDRVKFARETSTAEDSVRAEQAVETMLRRRVPPLEKVA